MDVRLSHSRRPAAVAALAVLAALALGACGVDASPLATAAQTAPRVRYPLAVHSPLSRDAVARWSASAAPSADQPFIKVGDSITVSHGFLRCFSQDFAPDEIVWPATPLSETLDVADLQATVDAFRATDILGTDPFARVSQAACGGKWAEWAVRAPQTYCSTNGITNGSNGITDVELEWDGGWPPPDEDRAISPLQREIRRANPSVALVMFGTNDLDNDVARDADGLRHPEWWAWRGEWYADHMLRLVDEIIDEGVVPVLYTIPPRTDVPFGEARVAFHNQIVRAIAESRGAPLIDYHHALSELVGDQDGDGRNDGVWGDGVHPSFLGGRACDFSPQPFWNMSGVYTHGRHGQNIRNLISIEMLARLRALLIEGSDDFDPPPPSLAGAGTVASPLIADRIPFSLVDRIEAGAASAIDSYDCGGSGDDGAGERAYLFQPEDSGTLHIRVLTRERDGSRNALTVSVSSAGEEPSDCLQRQRGYVRQAVEAGETYRVVVEGAAVDAEIEQEFTLVVWQ